MMHSSLLLRLHRKDALFQMVSDLMRHNSSNNNSSTSQTSRQFCLNTSQKLNSLPFCGLSGASLSKTLGSFAACSLNCVQFNHIPFKNRRFLSTNQIVSNDLSDIKIDDELKDFKLLSNHDKKVISKRLGLKLSYLQEIELKISSNLNKLALDFMFFENLTNPLNSCTICYAISNGRTGLRDENSSYIECNDSILNKQLSYFLSFDKLFIESLNAEVLPSDDAVVIVDDVFDAMAINQQTKVPTIVLKFLKDNNDFKSWKLFSDKISKHYQKVYLWSNNNEFRDNFRKFCMKRFDSSQLFIIQSDLNASQMLKADNKEKFSSEFQLAKCVDHPSILTFADLKSDVFKEFTDPAVNGVPWSRFPKLNEHLKGHRTGELTIVTGATGCGKTTFVSEYSLDLCLQGVPTLWGSFEIKNVRLAKMMLTQFARKSFDETMPEEFESESAKFSKNPLYFMKFHGQTEVDLVLETAQHAVTALGVRHVVIDNLQFMLGLNSDTNFDRFLKQDRLITSFRQFATQYDCHITLVAHPRKEKEEMELSNNSLYGGVKASQEADNVMIIMNKYNARFRCNKYVQITKNRFNGSLGVIPLYFDKNTLCFSSTLAHQMASESKSDKTSLRVVDDDTTTTTDVETESSKEVSDFYKEIRYISNLYGN